MQKIKKNDNVVVLLGRDRGKHSEVLQVLSKKGQLLVSGVNVVKRHVKKSARAEGGIIDVMKPIEISNVALICPSCQKKTRVGFKMTDNGKVRVCKHCHKEIK